MSIRSAIIAVALLFAAPALGEGIVNSGGGGGKTTDPTLAMHPGYVANLWYTFEPHLLTQAGAAGTASVINCAAGYVGAPITINQIGANVGTLSAGGNFQLALYSSVIGRPGALIAKTGNISTAAAGVINGSLGNTPIGPTSINAGPLWFCSNVDNATAVLNSLSLSTVPGRFLQGSANETRVVQGAAGPVGISCTAAACTGGSSTFNTWPASLAGSTWSDVITAVMPFVMFQIVSSP